VFNFLTTLHTAYYTYCCQCQPTLM